MSAPSVSDPRPARIAFAVGGVGMGNATRVGAVIDQLKGEEVRLLAFGNSLRWLRHRVAGVTELTPLVLGRNALHDLALAPWNLVGWLHNLVLAFLCFRRHRPDVLVVDSEYSTWIVAKCLGIPIVALNHAAAVLALWERFGRPELRWSYLTREVPDAWLCRRFDATLVPTFVDDVTLPPNHVAFGALTRDVPPWRGGAEHLLLLRGGSEHLSPVRMAPGLVVEEIGGAHKVDDALERMAAAKGVVCQGGMSSLSEVINMGAPAVCVPLPGHAEQQLMAAWAADRGLIALAPDGVIGEDQFPAPAPATQVSSAGAVAQWLRAFVATRRQEAR